MKLNAKQLRALKSSDEKISVNKNGIFIVLDNILDTYNIGAIFRLADAVAANRVVICGLHSETPPNHRIKKASVNTAEFIEWSYSESTVQAISDLRKENPGLKVVAIEQDKRSVPYDKFEYGKPVALVVGHETEGVSREVLEVCDGIVELPMFGVNISLNVMVSLAIVLYQAVRR